MNLDTKTLVRVRVEISERDVNGKMDPKSRTLVWCYRYLPDSTRLDEAERVEPLRSRAQVGEVIV